MYFSALISATLLLFSSATLATAGRAKRSLGPYPATEFSGALVKKDNGTFDTVLATFTVPNLSGAIGSTATPWIGIDSSVTLGIEMNITNQGPVYNAYYELTGDAIYLPNLPISAGDQLSLRIGSALSSSSYVTIENLTKGNSVSQAVSLTGMVGSEAEWAVNTWVNVKDLPLVNFGTITFTDAVATGNGVYSPKDGYLFYIEQNNQVLTTVSADPNGSSVTTSYVGP